MDAIMSTLDTNVSDYLGEEAYSEFMQQRRLQAAAMLSHRQRNDPQWRKRMIRARYVNGVNNREVRRDRKRTI